VNWLEAVIGAAEIMAIPAVYFFTPRKETTMSVDPKIQASLDQINISVQAIPGKVAAQVADQVAQAAAADAQDKADTEAAVQAAADNLKSVVGA
jgi:hypothetical protein